MCLPLSCNLSLTGLQLGGVNDNLATSVGEVQRPTATMLHTVDRHRDILVDYTEEFHKIQVSLGGMSSQPRLHACTRAYPPACIALVGQRHRTWLHN